jgi:hypothetical protein
VKQLSLDLSCQEFEHVNQNQLNIAKQFNCSVYKNLPLQKTKINSWGGDVKMHSTIV